MDRPGPPPFERAYVELVRPGGRTSHELRGILRERLVVVRALVARGETEAVLREIDDVLAKEAP